MQEPRIITLFDPIKRNQHILDFNAELHRQVSQFVTVKAVFPDIIARLHAHVSQKYLDGEHADELFELRALLPDFEQQFNDQLHLVPGCDLFNDKQVEALLSASHSERPKHLHPLIAHLENVLLIHNAIIEDLALKDLLGELIRYYENYRDSLLESDADLIDLLTPKPNICGVDLDFFELPYEQALELLCRDPNAKSVKKISTGRKPCIIVKGVVFKPNKAGGPGTCLATGHDSAASKFCLSIDRKYRAATPFTLLKIGHARPKTILGLDPTEEALLRYYNYIAFMEQLVQASTESKGVLIQIVLEIQLALKNWRSVHTDKELISLLNNATDEKNLQILKMTSGLKEEIQNELPMHLAAMKRLVKDYTPEKAFIEIPNILKKIDPYNLCAAIVAHVILGSTDLKADNVMLCWLDNPEREFYLEGIDLDLIFAQLITNSKSGHFVNLRCILLFFDLDIPFDERLRQELLEHPAIYILLSWFQMVYEDEKRFTERLAQRAFTKNDILENGRPALDQPFMLHPLTLPTMLTLLKDMQTILKKPRDTSLTLGQFVLEWIRVVTLYYQAIKKRHPDDIHEAYRAIADMAPTIEQALPDLPAADLENFNYSYVDHEKTTLSPQKALEELLSDYDHEGDMDEQFRFLNYLGANFSVKRLGTKKQKLDAMLVEAPTYMLADAISLLLQCSDKINDSTMQDETILHRVFSYSNLEKIPNSERILRLIMMHPALDVHKVTREKHSPLMIFISNAANYSPKFVESVLKMFAAKRTHFNQMTTVGTALDIAVSIHSVAVFSLLVSYGASLLKDPDSAMSLLNKLADDDPILTTLRVLNPTFLFKESLSLVSSSVENDKSGVMIEGEHHKKRGLKKEIAVQIFDEDGNFLTDKGVMYGSVSVLEVKHAGRTVFNALRHPSCPGFDIAFSRLNRIFGSCSAPFSELYHCKNKKGQPISLLLFGALNGERLSNILQSEELKNRVFSNIDRHSLTKFIFVQFLMRQINGSTDNIMVVPHIRQGQTLYSFIYMLNDMAFAPQTPSDQDTPPEKMFDYLKPFLSIPLDPLAVSELLMVKNRIALRDLLVELNLHEVRAKALFQSNQSSVIVSPRGKNTSQVSVPIGPGTITSLYTMIKALKKILKVHFEKNSKPHFTGNDLFHSAQTYFLPSHKRQSPEKTIPRGRSPSFLKSPRTRGQPQKDSTPATTTFLEAYANDAALRENYSVVSALRELSQIDHFHKTLSVALSELKRGELKAFHELKLDIFKQAAVLAITWSEHNDDVDRRETLIKTIISANISYTDLQLIGCHALKKNTKLKKLQTSRLEKLLKNSANLNLLNLSGSLGVDDSVCKAVQTYSFNLTVLILNRTAVSDMQITELRNLQIFSATHCSNLVRVNMTAPTITELNLESSNIKNLTLNTRVSKLLKLNINHCTDLDPKDIAQALTLSPNLQDFQHTNVQVFDDRPHFWYLSQKRTTSSDAQKPIVQNDVFRVNGVTITDEHLYKILEQPAFSTLDLRGSPLITRAIIATIISKVPTLVDIYCQLSFRPINQTPLTMKGNGATIKKFLQLPNGHFIFMYDNASYQVWNIQDIELIAQGKIGTKFTDAEILPNGDVIACCDSHAIVLDTVTWKPGPPLRLLSHLDGYYNYVKVIGNKWLVLGGRHLSLFEISQGEWLHRNTTPNISVTAMILTPNQKTLVIHSTDYGTYTWKVDSDTPFKVSNSAAPNIRTLLCFDNVSILRTGSKHEKPSVLNLQSRKISDTKFDPSVDFITTIPGEECIIGGPEKSELLIIDKRTRKKTFSFNDLIPESSSRKEKESNRVFGEPSVTRHGDLIISVGKFALLFKCDSQHLNISFCTSLPISLSIKLLHNTAHPNYLKISHPEKISRVEKLAMDNLREFIRIFFPATMFKIEDKKGPIFIFNIPPEDLCAYQKMFDSFVERAKEYQQSLIPKQAPLLSPRIAAGKTHAKLYSGYAKNGDGGGSPSLKHGGDEN